MKLEHGLYVEDKNNKVLGRINHIILDTWSGEQRKYVVNRDAPHADILFSPTHIDAVTSEKVRLNVAIEDLENK